MISFDDRVRAVEKLGFTVRQARFLTLVLLHSGVCLQRHYARASGLANGHIVREFFAALTANKFATAYPCVGEGRRLYHVHSKTLYRAIGEPDNRHRKLAILPRAIERLMLLDAVLDHPDVDWLATERDKLQYFTHERGVPEPELPSLAFECGGRTTRRYFTEKLPIGRRAAQDSVVLLYLAMDASGRGLRVFLDSHRSLLSRLPRWSLLVVLPTFLRSARDSHQSIFDTLVAPPIRMGLLEEFRWYCHARRDADRTNGPRPVLDEARYANARRAFGSSRYFAAYRDWLGRGEGSLNDLLSPRFHDAHLRGDIQIHFHDLPYHYSALVSTIGTA